MNIVQIFMHYKHGGTEKIIDYLFFGLQQRGHNVYTWIPGEIEGETPMRFIRGDTLPSALVPDIFILHCGLLHYEDYIFLDLEKYNVPIICVLHRLEVVKYNPNIKYIAVSNIVKQLQVFSDDCKVIHNPAILYNTTRKVSEIKKELNIDVNDIVIMRHCRFSMEKNWKDFINIVSPILSNNKDIKLVIVGREPGIVNYILSNWSKNKPVILLDWKENIQDYLQICDIYLDTSLDESYCLSLAEAASIKKPIVCLEASSTKELFPSIYCNNVNDAISLLSELVKNIDQRVQFGKECYELIKNKTSMNYFIDNYCSAILECFDRG